MITVKLFGPPAIYRPGEPDADLRRKNRAMIYYIAAHEHALSRDQLLAAFWPDRERPAAQKILRTMLYDLRQELGPALLVDDARVSLSADVLVDSRQFETGLHSSEARSVDAALALYVGAFLEGFNLPDSPEFDDWAAAERRRYEDLYVRGLAARASLYEADRDYTRALDTLERALALDALQEDLQRSCLRLHYFNGDRAGAIRRYEALRQLLDAELGVPPSPETRSLYDAIVTDSLPRPTQTERAARPAAAAPTPPPLLPFTGRSTELEAMRRAARAGQLVVVEGEAGVGKTRLLDEYLAAESAASPDLMILRGSAHELEQGLPYQPFIDALRGLISTDGWPAVQARLNLPVMWLAEVARLLPELIAGPTGPGAVVDEARLWEGMRQFLLALARERRLIIGLDDLHWADAASLGLLGYLARRAASPALVFLATSRPSPMRSPLGSLLQDLLRANCLTRLPLSPLSSQDLKAVAGHISPEFADLLAGWLSANSEGNPYFVTELVRYAQNNDILRADGSLDEPAIGSTPILPPTVQNLIQSRLIRLSEIARRFLDSAVVVGREFEFELVRRVAGLPESPALDALDELRTDGLIRSRTGDAYAFDHSLTMEVANREMGESRARSLHRQAAEVLENMESNRLDQAAGLIAFHYAHGGALERSAEFAVRAGHHAAGLAAWQAAGDFFEQALRGSPRLRSDSATQLALGRALFHAGHFTNASQTYSEAIRLAQLQGNLTVLEEAHIALNQSLMPRARYTEAAAQARALRETGPLELSVCAEFMWGTALAVESARPAEAVFHLKEAERLLPTITGYTPRITLAQIKYQLAGAVGQQGDSAQAVELYREALHLAGQAEAALDLLRRIMLFNNLAYHLGLLNELTQAADLARQGMALARERGSLSHLPFLLSTSGEIALAQGNLDQAEAHFAEGLALAERVPVPERIAGIGANLGRVLAARGQTAPARERLKAALAQADELDARHLAVRIRTWLAPLLPPEEAQALLADARRIAQASGFASLLAAIDRVEKNAGQP